jgi:predicted nucleotidyltransferase
LSARSLGSDFDPTIVAEIDRRLRSVCKDHHACVLFAVESGSRAWGFPSPDSDYDCRFIFARRRDDYLSLYPQSDVIEFTPDEQVDVNGWDLGKALRLLLKGNAVVIEWLSSPFIYAGDLRFREEALELVRQVAHPQAIASHYLHLGERQRRAYFADGRSVPFKKLFYALRPALALRWLRLHSGAAVAPMHFPTLAAQSDLPSEVLTMIDELLRHKALTRELGVGPVPQVIGAIIDSEFSLARELWSDRARRGDLELREVACRFFRRWIEEGRD